MKKVSHKKPKAPTNRTVFWLAVPGSTETIEHSFFDFQTIRFIAEHASLVVLNLAPEGPVPPLIDLGRRAYDFKRIVDIFHALKPDLPVLAYGQVTRWVAPNQGMPLNRVECREMERFLIDLPSLRFSCESEGFLFYDIRSEEFRNNIAVKLKAFFRATGADGIMYDFHFRNPAYSDTSLTNHCLSGDEGGFCVNYASGMDELHTYLKRKFPTKLLLFNGGVSFAPHLEAIHGRPISEGSTFESSVMKVMIEDTTLLLEKSDGLTIERFGHKRNNRLYNKFSFIIKPYLTNLLQLNPEKILLVIGVSLDSTASERGTYESDYLWQRYLFGCYLLAKTSKSLFKYHATFQPEPKNSERSCGRDMYSDWLLDFGKPLSKRYITRSDGLLMRKFKKGIVLVNPHDEEGEKPFLVSSTMYDAERIMISGTICVPVGRAMFLFYEPPVISEATEIIFGNYTNPGVPHWIPVGRWSSLIASRRSGASSHYLRIKELPDGFTDQVWENDLLLEGVRAHPAFISPNFEISLRKRDGDLTLLFVVEVDDAELTHNYVILEVSQARTVGPVGENPNLVGSISYRSSISTRKEHDYYLFKRHTWNKEWETLTLNGDMELASIARFSFKRWAYMRVIGKVDFEWIRMT